MENSVRVVRQLYSRVPKEKNISSVELKNDVNNLIARIRKNATYTKTPKVKQYKYSEGNTQITLEDIDETALQIVIVNTDTEIYNKRHVGKQIVILAEEDSMQVSISYIYRKMDSNIILQYATINENYNDQYLKSEFIPIESLGEKGISLISEIIGNLTI